MLHEGEFAIDERLIRNLIEAQFPKWAELELARVESSGTVNVMHRLGDTMVVRMPRINEFSAGPEREAIWLPKFAAHLPLAIPEFVALGEPTAEYPSPWSVLGWIEGENADGSTLADLGDAARRLGEFVVALRGIDPTGAPHGNYRGHGLAKRDLQTRAAIESVGNEFDATTLHAVWEAALREPEWTGAPTWFHGDLHSGNLLARDRRLSAVVDFEGCSVGDPTSDLIAGWWLFDPASRQVFREAIGTDDASWARGRAWALSTAVIALPYYIDTNLAFADMARRAISHVVNDR